jgi:netrin receptor unc-5
MLKLLVLTAVLVATCHAAFTMPEANRTRADPKPEAEDPCYDAQTGTAQRCIPPFENVAFSKQVLASSQCGTPEMSYCIQPLALNRNIMQLSGLNRNKHCDVCDATRPHKYQGTEHLTDLEEANATCWISEPVYKPTAPSNITLKISFGKKYELTYISMQFCTALKPDSVSILKSMDHGRTWSPFQFYSSECEKVFGLIV